MTGTVDAHHHIWRQIDLPWLMGPMQPRIFGPYEAIRRDYLIDEYLDDIKTARDIKFVVKDGVVYNAAELLQSVEGKIGPGGPDDHADWELDIRPLRED